MKGARALLAAALAGGCLLAPNLARYGYTSCKSDGDCVSAGRVCQSGYCSPPPWWDGKYLRRRQVLFHNTGQVVIPKGFPLRLPVGPEPRPFKSEEFTPYTRVVALDRVTGVQVEQPVAVDVLSLATNAFDSFFPAPSDIPAGATLADIYVYSYSEGTTPRADARTSIFPLNDEFEGTTLDLVWHSFGAVNLSNGDEVVRRTGDLWSTKALPGTPGVALTVEFQADQRCQGLAMGLMAGPTTGFTTPYVMVTTLDDLGSSSSGGVRSSSSLPGSSRASASSSSSSSSSAASRPSSSLSLALASTSWASSWSAPSAWALTSSSSVGHSSSNRTGSGGQVRAVLTLQLSDMESPAPNLRTPFVITGATQRLDLVVSGTSVVLSVDGLAVETYELHAPITAELRPHFLVDGGSCTLSIHKLRMRPALVHEPMVEPQALVGKAD